MNLGLRFKEQHAPVLVDELEALVIAILTAWTKEHSPTDGHVNLTVEGQTVSFGANDSAGAGYRWLRVPNA